MTFRLRSLVSASNAAYMSRLAGEPELTNTACRVPSHRAQDDSNSRTSGPCVSHGLVCNQAASSFSSAGLMVCSARRYLRDMLVSPVAGEPGGVSPGAYSRRQHPFRVDQTVFDSAESHGAL